MCILAGLYRWSLAFGEGIFKLALLILLLVKKVL